MSAPSKTPDVEQDDNTYCESDVESHCGGDPQSSEQLHPPQQLAADQAATSAYDEPGLGQNQQEHSTGESDGLMAVSAQDGADTDDPDAFLGRPALREYWYKRDRPYYDQTKAIGGTLLETDTDIKLWGVESTPKIPSHDDAAGGVAPTFDSWPNGPAAHDATTGLWPDPFIMPPENTTTKPKKRVRKARKHSTTYPCPSDQPVEMPIPGLCWYQNPKTSAWSQPCADASMALRAFWAENSQTEKGNDSKGRTADTALSNWFDQATSFQNPHNGRWERLSSEPARDLATMENDTFQAIARVKKPKKGKGKVGQTRPASADQQPDPQKSTEDSWFDNVNCGITGPFLPGPAGSYDSAGLSTFAYPPVNGYPVAMIDRGTSPVLGSPKDPSEAADRPQDPDGSRANQGFDAESRRAVSSDLHRYPDWWCSDGAAELLYGQRYVEARQTQRSLGRVGISLQARGRQRNSMITHNMVEKMSDTGRDCLRSSADAASSFASYVRFKLAETSGNRIDAYSDYWRTPTLSKMPIRLAEDIERHVGRSTNGFSLLADTIANCNLLSNVASFTFRNPHLRAQNLTRLNCLHSQVGTARPPTVAQWQEMKQVLSREVGTEVAVALQASAVGYSEEDREQVVQSALATVLDSGRTCCGTGDHDHIRMPAALQASSSQDSAATLVSGIAVPSVVAPSHCNPDYTVETSPWF